MCWVKNNLTCDLAAAHENWRQETFKLTSGCKSNCFPLTSAEVNLKVYCPCPVCYEFLKKTIKMSPGSTAVKDQRPSPVLHVRGRAEMWPSVLILQTRMRSHPMRLDVWFLVGLLPHFMCANSEGSGETARMPELSLVACISTIISWGGSNMDIQVDRQQSHQLPFPREGDRNSRQNRSNIWASSWDYGTYQIGDQRRFGRACASAQSHQSLSVRTYEVWM